MSNSKVVELRSDPPAAEPGSSVARRTYLELRRRILRGDYPPGSSLTLRRVAEELEISIMPVRDAITRLGAEAALIVEPNRLIRVPVLPREDLLDLWSIRIHVEGDVAERAASGMDARDIEALRHAHNQVHAAFDAQDPMRMLEHVHGFATTLCRRHPVLASCVENIRIRLAPSTGLAIRDRLPLDTGFYGFSLRLQDEMVEAIRQGDAAKAGQLRRVDLQTFRDWVLRSPGLAPGRGKAVPSGNQPA